MSQPLGIYCFVLWPVCLQAHDERTMARCANSPQSLYGRRNDCCVPNENFSENSQIFRGIALSLALYLMVGTNDLN